MNISLYEEEIFFLRYLANNITACPSTTPELYMKQVKHASQFIPYRIQYFLHYFLSPTTSEDKYAGYIVLRKLPTEDKPSTPEDNTHHLGEKTILARIQAIFNQVLGEMVAYEAEGYGRLYQDMVPNKHLASTQTSLSSQVELEIHTEQAFSPLRPDFLSLACIRGDPNAKTYLFHKRILFDCLPLHKIEMLFQPLWKIGVDMSFKTSPDTEFLYGDIRGPIPIIDRNTGDFVFDQDLMFGITEEAEDLKREIIAIYKYKKSEIVLEEGDVVILNNRRVVHGRSSFQPRYHGQDRFILRSFVMRQKNFQKFIYARPNEGRMIGTKYS
jgi:L-asparagine oxygenase